MPRLIVLVLVFVLVLERRADAERVVLADADLELLHALESSLAPWQMTIIVDARPVTEATAAKRADDAGARFLVWRERSELVVYDRTTNAAERRPARTGAFDNVSAAAAALTVKTLMRLPPPEIGPPPPPPGGGDVVAPPPPAPGLAVRLEVGAGGRVGFASDVGFGGRLVLGAMIQPGVLPAWRFGLRADLGPATSIERSGVRGTWFEWGVVAAASYALATGAWELEPWVGMGLSRGVLDVSEMTTSREERATLFEVRGGVIARRRFGSLTAGTLLALSFLPGAPTYTRETMGSGTPTLFEASKFSLVFGIVLAADLGR